MAIVSHRFSSSNHERRYRDQYTTRVLAGIAASLLLVIVAVKAWPLPDGDAPSNLVFSTRGQEVIEIEEIIPTSQREQIPPPPAPLPPIVVPTDVILDDVPLEFSDSLLPIEEPGLDPELTPGDEGPTANLAQAESGPKPVRIVEPEYTREARRKKIRAEVVVEVLIDEKGRVQESKIVERFILGDDDDPKEVVAEIGYGIEEAAINAAERWLFRPARQNGAAVRSYHPLTFRFGV